MTFQFDDVLFQRGMTWRECVETWLPQRDQFLEWVHNAQVLPKTQQTCNGLPATRLAVLFNPRGLDSLRTLPFLGKTLRGCNTIQVRYFNYHWFFPLFQPHFDRKTPRLLILNQDGAPTAQWGPRPRQLNQDLTARLEADQWLTQMSDAQYAGALDPSISQLFSQVEN